MASIDFPVLKLINDSRSTYGLRHQDFGRYKSHCATKVQHLRKSVGLVQTSGRIKKFTKKEITEKNATSDRHLQILLFDSERAWAHSQLLKSTLSLPTASSKTKHHLARRLARALIRSDHLLSIVNSFTSSQISTSQKAQTTAYYLYMKGSLAFEQSKHKEGLESLSTLFELLRILSETSETAQEEALANEMMDEIEPMLRFCAYTLRMDISNGVGEVAKSITSTEGNKLIKGWNELVGALEKISDGKEERETVELIWRGEEIPIRNVELVKVVLKVKLALSSLEADKIPKKIKEGKKNGTSGGRVEVMGTRRMGTFDKALFVLSEAEEIARQLMEDNQIALSRSTSTRFEASSASLSLAHSYIVYQHLSVRIKRDLLLIEDTSSKLNLRIAKIQKNALNYLTKNETVDTKLTEIKMNKQKAKVYPSLIRVYENVILSLEKMRDLEIVEKDGELAGTVEARIAFVRASRCLYLSRSYALISQFPSSLSLNSRAKLYSRESQSSASYLTPIEEDSTDLDFSGDLLQLSNSDFYSLDSELDSDYIRISKDWFNFTGGDINSNNEVEELEIEGLTLEEGTNSKGKGKSKEKKPTFYDVAFNYVAEFNLDAIAVKAGLIEAVPEPEVEMEQEEEEEEDVEMEVKPVAQKKGGWGYLFGR